MHPKTELASDLWCAKLASRSAEAEITHRRVTNAQLLHAVTIGCFPACQTRSHWERLSVHLNVPTRGPTAAARRLLEEMLDSFEKLEITIALHRAAAPMSTSELSTKLQLQGHTVERGLDELARAGSVHLADGTARLTLPVQDLPAMDEIVALYDEDRLLIVRTLTEISMEKIRGMAARAFADAFHLRRKKEDRGDG